MRERTGLRAVLAAALAVVLTFGQVPLPPSGLAFGNGERDAAESFAQVDDVPDDDVPDDGVGEPDASGDEPSSPQNDEAAQGTKAGAESEGSDGAVGADQGADAPEEGDDPAPAPGAEQGASAEAPRVVFAFDGNGATTGSMSDFPYALDAEEHALPANGFSRDGYEFAGWSTTRDGKDDPDARAWGGKPMAAVAVPDAQRMGDLRFTETVEGDDGTERAEERDLSSAIRDGRIVLFAQWKEITDQALGKARRSVRQLASGAKELSSNSAALSPDGFVVKESALAAASASATTSAPYRVEWVGDDETTRPGQVIVYLQRSTDGGTTWENVALAQVVKENVDGTWGSEFTALSADGGVKYRVVQTSVPSVYSTSYSYEESGGVATTVITNTLKSTGSLRVGASVSGETDTARARTTTFTLKVTIAGVSYPLMYVRNRDTGVPYDGTFQTNANGELTLNRGESAVFENIQGGSSYSVSFVDAPAGYTSNPSSGQIESGGTSKAFVRIVYNYGTTVSVDDARVTLSNRAIAENQFRFSLYDVSDLSWDDANNCLASGVSPTDGARVQRMVNTTATGDSEATTVAVQALALSTADADKTLRYALVQDDRGVDGYTYDDAVYYLVGSTSADTTGDGAMTTPVPFAWYGPQSGGAYAKLDEGERPLFQNSYDGKGVLEIGAEADLLYGKLADEQFEFAAYDLGVDAKPASIAASGLSTVYVSGKNNAYGEVDIDAEFGMQDVGKTRYLLLTQVVPATPEANVTYDRTGYLLAVAVSDADASDESRLGTADTWYRCTWDEAAQTWTPEGEAVSDDGFKPTFENELARGSLSIVKRLSDDSETQAAGAGRSFTFKVRLSGEGAPGEDEDDELNIETATAPVLSGMSVSAVSARVAKELSDLPEGLVEEGPSAAAIEAAAAEVDLLGTIAGLFAPERAYADGGTVTGTNTFGDNDSVTWVRYDDGSLVIKPTTEGTQGSISGTNVASGSGMRWASESSGSDTNILYKTGITSITFEGDIVWKGAMRDAFNGCTDLQSVDFGNVDTSQVVSMWSVFHGCTALTDVSFGSRFDTSKVGNMRQMFYYCSALERLDLSGFNTSSNTSLWQTFANCSAMREIVFGPGFSTSNVTEFRFAFYGCKELKRVDLSTFDTSKGANLYRMFHSTKFESITFGDAFSFKGNGSITENTSTNTGTADLPALTAASPYSGKWVRTDDSSLAFTSAELKTQAPTTLQGTWVWQLDDTHAIVNFDAGAGALAGSQASSATSTRADSSSAFSPVALPAAASVTPPEGYELKGWTLSADGSGMAYTDAFTPTANTTYTLYAQYRQSKPTKSADGWWTVSVAAGEKLTIKDLPDGVTYEVYEQTEAGWTLVSPTGTVTGAISAGADSSAEFTNKYEVGTATAVLRGDVTLDGAASDEQFAFTLAGQGVSGTAASATSNDAGSFQFAPVKFQWDTSTLTANGVALTPDATGGKVYTLQYTIAQVQSEAGTALAYDANGDWTATFTVTVPDGAGSPTVSDIAYTRSSDSASSAGFANAIRKGSITVSLAAAGGGPEADFPITVKLMGMRKAGSGTALASEDVAHVFAGTSAAALVLSDVPAGTSYTVERGTPPGVWVADDPASSGLSGTLALDQGATANATVGYKYEPSGLTYDELTVGVRTTLDGATFGKGKFSFRIANGSSVLATAACGVPDYSGDETTNDEYGQAAASLAVSAADMKALGLGTHVLKVSMTGKTDASIAYDEHECEITVTVTDAGDGSVAYAVTYPSESGSGTLFANAMKPATLKVTKVTQGATAASEHTGFTFEVALADADDEDEPVSPAGATVSIGDGAAQALAFTDGVASFEMEGAASPGKTAVVEGLPGGVAYTVTERDARGWSVVSGYPTGAEGTTVAGGEREAVFANEYSIQGTAEIGALVKYGRRLQGNDFSFRLWHSDADGKRYDAAADGSKGALHADGSDSGFIQQNANAADGTVSFIREFDTATAQDDHYFLVEQVVDERDGVSVSFDKNMMLVKVTLEDDGQGGLEPTCAYWKVEPEGLSPATIPGKYEFNNTFIFSLPLTGGSGDPLWLLLGCAVAVAGAWGFSRRPERAVRTRVPRRVVHRRRHAA